MTQTAVLRHYADQNSPLCGSYGPIADSETLSGCHIASTLGETKTVASLEDLPNDVLTIVDDVQENGSVAPLANVEPSGGQDVEVAGEDEMSVTHDPQPPQPLENEQVNLVWEQLWEDEMRCIDPELLLASEVYQGIPALASWIFDDNGRSAEEMELMSLRRQRLPEAPLARPKCRFHELQKTFYVRALLQGPVGNRVKRGPGFGVQEFELPEVRSRVMPHVIAQRLGEDSSGEARVKKHGNYNTRADTNRDTIGLHIREVADGIPIASAACYMTSFAWSEVVAEMENTDQVASTSPVLTREVDNVKTTTSRGELIGILLSDLASDFSGIKDGDLRPQRDELVEVEMHPEIDSSARSDVETKRDEECQESSMETKAIVNLRSLEEGLLEAAGIDNEDEYERPQTHAAAASLTEELGNEDCYETNVVAREKQISLASVSTTAEFLFNNVRVPSVCIKPPGSVDSCDSLVTTRVSVAQVPVSSDYVEKLLEVNLDEEHSPEVASPEAEEPNDIIKRFVNGIMPVTVQESQELVATACQDVTVAQAFTRYIVNRQHLEAIYRIFLCESGCLVRLALSSIGLQVAKSLVESCESPAALEAFVQMSADSIPSLLSAPNCRRLLQQIVVNATTDSIKQTLATALCGCVYELSVDPCLSYVVQMCINQWGEHASFIFEAVPKHCVQLSVHRLGCCVVVRCIQYGDYATKRAITERILCRTNELCNDPYGNYVIQFIVSEGQPRDIHEVAVAIQENVIRCARQKCSSNVVERLVKTCEPEDRDMLVAGIAGSQESVLALMFSEYGNYVVQTALETSTNLDHIKNILGGIKQALQRREDMREPTFVVARLLRKFPELTTNKDLTTIAAARVRANSEMSVRRTASALRDMDEPFGARRRQTRNRRQKEQAEYRTGKPRRPKMLGLGSRLPQELPPPPAF